MTSGGPQQPNEGASTGLSPLAIGLALTAAAAVWMLVEWVSR